MNKYQVLLSTIALSSTLLVGCANTSIMRSDVHALTGQVDQPSNLVRVTFCPVDFNGSGSLTVQDLFDFLTAYFAGDLRADFNASGTVTGQDIFDFLNAYFAGCP